MIAMTVLVKALWEWDDVGDGDTGDVMIMALPMMMRK